MRSDCYVCHSPKENPQENLCMNCQTIEKAAEAEIVKSFPDATPDQVLYLKREHMKANGWHSRSGWTDPRGFNPHTR